MLVHQQFLDALKLHRPLGCPCCSASPRAGNTTFSEFCRCTSPWAAFAPPQDVLVHQQFLDIFIVIVSAGIMHLIYLAFNFAAVL